MKQATLCLLLLVAVQCLTFTSAEDFCSVDGPLFVSDSDDVRVTMTTSTSHDAKEFDWSQDALSFDGPAFEPPTANHTIHQGNCLSDDRKFVYTINTCTYPDPENGTASLNFTVSFESQQMIISCIDVVDTYFNDEGDELGGYPFVDDGGIGYEFVALRLVSQEAEGMKFHMEITAFAAETTTDDTTPVDSSTTETTATETTATETTATETTATETTTTETTTAEATTTPAKAAGISRGNWLMLSCIVLFLECIFMGNQMW